MRWSYDCDCKTFIDTRTTCGLMQIHIHLLVALFLSMIIKPSYNYKPHKMTCTQNISTTEKKLSIVTTDRHTAHH